MFLQPKKYEFVKPLFIYLPNRFFSPPNSKIIRGSKAFQSHFLVFGPISLYFSYISLYSKPIALQRVQAT